MGKPEGKRPLGRPRRRWDSNINRNLQEVGWGGHGLDRSGSGKGQAAGTCECGSETSGVIKWGGGISLPAENRLVSQEGL